MKVSIITATYNSKQTLQRTIDSVINQDYKDIEHIVIDGGSADGTVEIISKNKANIAKSVSEKDSGIYEALNKGICLSTGDIIGILNSDDVFADSNIISAVVECFSRNSSDIVYGNLKYVSKNKTIRYWKSNAFNPKMLKYGWMPPHPTLFCKKEIFECFGKYKESFKIAADYDFILRVFRQRDLKIDFLPILMVIMTIGGKSNGTFKNICKKSTEDLKAIKTNNAGGFYTLILKNLRKLRQLYNTKAQ